MTTSDRRHETGRIFRTIIEVFASAAAIVSAIFLIVVPLNTYIEESLKLGDLYVVLALSALGYLSPKTSLRYLPVFAALGSLCEIWTTSHQLHH